MKRLFRRLGASLGFSAPSDGRPVRELIPILSELRALNGPVGNELYWKLHPADDWSESAGLRALDEATTFPPGETPATDSGALLINGIKRMNPPGTYISKVAKVFDRLSPFARQEAVSLLSYSEAEQSARIYLSLLPKYSEDAANGLDGYLAAATRHRHLAPILFPAVMPYGRLPHMQHPVHRLCYEYLRRADIHVEQLQRWLPQMIQVLNDHDPILRRRSDPVAGELDSEQASQHEQARRTSGLLLDLIGRVPSEAAAQTIATAIENYNDPFVKQYAILAAFRLGDDVRDDHLLAVAKDVECRGPFLVSLREINQGHRFPASYLKQELIAESRMVDWLLFPTELGDLPQQMELMNAYEVRDRFQDRWLYYIYRFRPKPSQLMDDQWMAGVSGPFPATGPVEFGGGATFSHFEAWESKSPQEHLRNVIADDDTFIELPLSVD